MSAYTPSSDLEAELVRILRADPELMQVMAKIRELDLPDWRVFSGAVYQSVWNARTGRPVGYGRKDYDVGYFDPDTSWDAEDAYIQRVAAAFDEPLKSMVEVRNQARVHIWFPDKFRESYTPLPDTDTALGRFVAPAFAVGVRLEADDSLSIAAPFGLADLFNMVLRPNPNREPAKGWDKAVASAAVRWPELAVVAPV